MAADFNGDGRGDFNGDGRLDLVVTLNDPVTSLSLLTGNGDGTFNAPVNFPNTSGFGSPAVAAVDLNNDARLDVVIAHDFACFTAPCVATTLMSVMMGNGDGTFQPTREIAVGRGMTAIAVGDYNRDGFRTWPSQGCKRRSTASTASATGRSGRRACRSRSVGHGEARASAMRSSGPLRPAAVSTCACGASVRVRCCELGSRTGGRVRG